MSQAFIAGSFRLDRMRNASAQVFDHLRERIIALELKPGLQLQRDELSAYFDLSVTPIRDALTRLCDEGLVDITAKQPTVVRGIDIDSARQAHFLRLSLELEIVKLLARQHDGATLATLENLISQQALALSHGDYAAFAQADFAFHRHMYVAARLEALWHWMRRESGHLDRLRRLHLPSDGKAQAVLADHAAIVAAIAHHDGERAQRAVRQHLAGTMAQWESIRAEHPEFMLAE